jgi:hypothetical protein
MACSGLHCAGCAGGGIAVPVVPLIAIYGLVWVAEHIIEVAIVSAVCGVLAVAAMVALMRWADRMDCRRAARWQLVQARKVPEVVTVTATALPGSERATLGFRDLHIHLDGQPTTEQAAVIRQALGRN